MERNTISKPHQPTKQYAHLFASDNMFAKSQLPGRYIYSHLVSSDSRIYLFGNNSQIILLASLALPKPERRNAHSVFRQLNKSFDFPPGLLGTLHARLRQNNYLQNSIFK